MKLRVGMLGLTGQVVRECRLPEGGISGTIGTLEYAEERASRQSFGKHSNFRSVLQTTGSLIDDWHLDTAITFGSLYSILAGDDSSAIDTPCFVKIVLSILD